MSNTPTPGRKLYEMALKDPRGHMGFLMKMNERGGHQDAMDFYDGLPEEIRSEDLGSHVANIYVNREIGWLEETIRVLSSGEGMTPKDFMDASTDESSTIFIDHHTLRHLRESIDAIDGAVGKYGVESPKGLERYRILMSSN